MLLSCVSGKAEYSYMLLPELVWKADYVAIGTIVAINNSYFFLKVDSYVMDSLASDTLKIQKFENWTCGRRYDKYAVGQKELVFFRKSNYVLPDYELLGYGYGGESELPILNDSVYYHFGYDGLQPYQLDQFITMLRDFSKMRYKARAASDSVSQRAQQRFATKSTLHKQLIEYKNARYSLGYDIPDESVVINKKKNYIYKDYENKVIIANLDNSKISLFVEDAEVWKQDEYFIVKPENGRSKRRLTVYALNDSNKKKLLFSQMLNVYNLPQPRLYFSIYDCDVIHYGHFDNAIPRVANFTDAWHEDRLLKYELLNYTYQINAGGVIKRYKVKSAYGNKDLRDQIKNLLPGNTVTICDALVLYPNNTVKQLKEKQ